MRRSGHALAAVCAVLLAISHAEAVTLPPATTTTSFVVLTSGVSNPFGAGTLLQTVNAPSQSLTSISNINHQPFTRAAVSLTTQVYQLAPGTLGFAYTINAQSFRDPLDPFDSGEAVIPRLTVPGFDTVPADVNVSMIPTGFGVAPFKMTVYRAPAANDSVVYSFANDSVPANVPAFTSLYANGSITAFAATDAPSFRTATAVVTMMLRDARQPNIGSFFDLQFQSLAPNLGEPPVGSIPEPATLGLLALATGSLAWKLRRTRRSPS